MAIDQHADYSISVHQRKYIEKMLDKFVPSHSVNSVLLTTLQNYGGVSRFSFIRCGNSKTDSNLSS